MPVCGGVYLFSVCLVGKLRETVVLNLSALGTHTLILQQIRKRNHWIYYIIDDLLLVELFDVEYYRDL